MKLRFAIAACAAVVVVLGVTSAGAEKERDKSYYQKELESWSTVIAELQVLDVAKQSSEDIERIRNLVSQGQAFVAAEKLEEVEPILERSASLAALVRARSERIEVEKQAESAEAAAASAESAAQTARDAAAAAEKRYEELEAKGL